MKYGGTINIIDDDGNIVFERELSADEMIAELLHERSRTAGEILSAGGYTVNQDNAAPVLENIIDKVGGPRKKKEKKAPTGKRQSTCGKCGNSGHNAKTCGKADKARIIGDPDFKERGDKDAKADADIRLRIKRMVEGGIDGDSIKEAVRRAGYTAKQYSDQELEELIAWAQK